MSMSAQQTARLRVTPSGPLRGEIRVAADKSISHRAVMLSALALGISRVQNLLEGADVLATIGAFRQMGVSIERAGAGEYIIHGVGLRGLQAPHSALDMGNSGTALRLMAGLLCAQPWPSTLTGDASLRARPMGRIIEPLRRMGADISASTEQGAQPPLHISPVSRLRGIDYVMPVASAQVKSCVLLAGLYAEGSTSVTEPLPTRDHTERMLARFARRLTIAAVDDAGDDAGKKVITLEAGGEWRACEIRVPADLSSAAFFLVGASIIPESDVLLRGVGVNPSRNGVLAILKKMGADIELSASATVGGEPVADLRVRAAELRGCSIAGGETASAIDEIPVIAVAAACARGVTEIRDAGELRVKESDRIHAVAMALKALGIGVQEHADGLTISGARPSGGRVESHGDHRIAMAFAMAGGAATAPVEVLDCENIATSFPEFCRVAQRAGLAISPGLGAND